MRPISLLGAPIKGQENNWYMNALREIERASKEENYDVADKFIIENLTTPTYTLDVATATASDIAAVLGTLLNDMKKRGQNRGM
jgi:hypothetical protein